MVSASVRLLLTGLLAGGQPAQTWAATLLTWDITSTTGSTSGSAPGSLAVGLSGSVLDGSTLTTGNSTSPANTWNRTYQTFTYSNAADAMANGQYLSWTTTVDAGYTASFTGITGMTLAKTSNGPQAVSLWYSTDGTSFFQTGSSSVVPGSPATAFSSGMATTPIVLDGGASGATITWRMVAYSGTGGRLGISRTSTDDFSMLGTVTGGFARDLTWVGSAGVGTWNTDPANTPWTASGSASSFASNDNVAFAIPGTVTVAGAVSAGAMTVSHTSGTLTIEGGSFSSTSLVKTGAGDLVLSGANDIAGGTTVRGGRLFVAAPGAVGTKAIAMDGGSLMLDGGSVASLTNAVTVGAAGAVVSSTGDVSLSGAVLPASGGPGTVFSKVGPGTLTLSGAFGVQTTAPIELDVSEGGLTLAGSQKNIGGVNEWNGPVALNGSIVMIHGGTVGGSGTATNASPGSVIASRLNAGPVTFQSGLALDQTLTGSSPNGNNSLRFLGPMAGGGGFTAAGNGTKQLWGANTYTGPTRIVAGTLVLGTRGSIYGGVTTDWTSSQFTVQSGATASFRVGGVGQFEPADFDVLLSLGSATDGFLPGSRAGFDTTDGSFSYGNAIADPNGGLNAIGVTKSGSNTLFLSGSNTYTGSTQVTGGTLDFETRQALYGGIPGSWNATNLIVSSGATAAFGVGGADGFTADDIAAIAVLGSGTGANGFLSGSRLGFDTSPAGLFTYANVLADPDGGARSLGIVKLGSGTLALTAANSYTGGTTIQEGTLELGNAAALGTAAGPLVIDGGVLDLHGRSLSTTTLSGTGGVITTGVPGPATLTVTVASGTTTYAGRAADGSGLLSLVKTGAGYLELTGSSSWSGGTSLSGDVGITQATGLGVGPIIASGSDARVRWSGTDSTVTIANPLVTGVIATEALAFRPGAGNTVVLTGSISGAGQLKISASVGATLDLTSQTAATNTNTGGIEIGTGRILISSGDSLGGGVVNFGTGSNSILALSGPAATVTNAMTIGSTTGTTAGIANIDSGTGLLTLAGPIATRAGNAAGSLVKIGSGTVRLTAANTYSGSTSIREGVLQLASLEAVAASRVIPHMGGTLSLAAYQTTVVGGLDPNAGGLVDVGNGLVSVANGLSAPDMLAAIVTGLGDGTWNGTNGITSTVVANDQGLGLSRAVGWLDNGDGTVTFAYAAPGDTNLDWSVDLLDVATYLSAGKFDTGAAASWSEGDYTYDGVVDITDVALSLGTDLFDTGAYNLPAPLAGGVAAVPEPAGTAGVGLVAWTIWLTRRRKFASA
jgi:autotransporter-associated beta strand protein